MPRPNQGPYLKFIEKRGRFYIQWSESGRVRQSSTGTRDREQAQAALQSFIAERHADQQRGKLRAPDQFPIAEALDTYGEEHAPDTADPARIGYAMEALLRFWGEQMIGDITAAACKGYERQRDAARGTVRRELTTLRAAVNWAHKHGRLTYAPAVHLPAVTPGKDRWLTRNEAAALLRAALSGHPSSRLTLPLFIVIGLYTGARKEAILSLRWHQIDLENGRINFADPSTSTTNKRRSLIPIPRQLMTFLKFARRRGSDIGPVIHRDGKRIKDIKRSFGNACGKAGLDDVTPHTLRHTCGTWLAQAGVPLNDIGAWLGHADNKTTQLYAHHHPDFMQAALDAFDRRHA